jgi:hypothetical protein
MMNDQKSFTLVELLVSIFIIILLTGIIFANYRQSGNQLALQRAAHKLALDIRRAEEMAMSAKEFQGMVPSGGYGLHFNQTDTYHYILFADCNGNFVYDPPPALPCNGYSENVEGEIGYAQGVYNCLLCYGSLGTVDIVFIPPEPKVNFDPDESEHIFGLMIAGSSNVKKIYVNKAGLIDIRE